MIGKTLSHYNIVRKLGEGGMGEVYQARDTTLDRDVALKVLPEALAGDPERRKRFQREAKAIAALKHPNIVTIHTVEEADGVPFITMELVEGKTLSKTIGAGGCELETFFDVAIALADAVSSAHGKGVAHRDLKPSNIMFDAEGRLKVLDFGLAKLFESDIATDKTAGPESDTAAGRVLGTAAYMSPEQAEGTGVDHRSDIFSLGIIFYEMLTGERPFQGKTTISTLSAILRDTPAPVSDIKPLLPRHLSRIIRRCLEKDPDRRYQTALDLRNDLLSLKEETADPSSISASEHTAAQVRAVAAVDVKKAGRGMLLKFGVPALVVLIAAVAFLMMRAPSQVVESGVMRLAVLPFENLGDADDEYFADGITDEITAKLANISALAVISRASARKYKATEKDIQTVGSELNVDYILSGTIRWDKSRGREKVRITPQLIKVADDANVWAANYEREIDEIFAVQADIARQIAGALDVTLGTAKDGKDTGPPTANVSAYQIYLRSLKYDEEDERGLLASVDLLEKATELDPKFAVAWAELSRNNSGLYHHGFDRTPERLKRAKEAADRAMALDSQLVDAYLAMGYYYYWGHRDYDRALEAIDVAETLSPNESRVLELKSYVLRRQGKLRECLDYMKRAFDLNPQSTVMCRDLGFTCSLLRKYAEMKAYYERAILMAPDFWNTYLLAAEDNVNAGDTTAAVRLMTVAPDQGSVEFGTEAAWLWWSFGRHGRLLAFALDNADEMLWEQESAIPGSYWAARVYEARGERDNATRYYEAALALLQTEVEKLTEDHRLHAAIGLVCAALGRKETAIQHGRQAIELMPMTKDLLNGASTAWLLAMIYATAGDPDMAFEALEDLLAKPTPYTAWTVRMQPEFDALRDDPRYEALVARYEVRVP